MEVDENDNLQEEEGEVAVDIVVDGGIICRQCLKTFETKRKLSQHKRDTYDKRPGGQKGDRFVF